MTRLELIEETRKLQSLTQLKAFPELDYGIIKMVLNQDQYEPPSTRVNFFEFFQTKLPDYCDYLRRFYEFYEI